jgi:hypothetical protein
VLVSIIEQAILDMSTGEVALDRLDAVLLSGTGSHVARGTVAVMTVEDN